MKHLTWDLVSDKLMSVFCIVCEVFIIGIINYTTRWRHFTQINENKPTIIHAVLIATLKHTRPVGQIVLFYGSQAMTSTMTSIGEARCGVAWELLA